MKHIKDEIVIKKAKEPIQKMCGCGCDTFCVYYYENDKIDYIECAKCGTNIDWAL